MIDTTELLSYLVKNKRTRLKVKPIYRELDPFADKPKTDEQPRYVLRDENNLDYYPKDSEPPSTYSANYNEKADTYFNTLPTTPEDAWKIIEGRDDLDLIPPGTVLFRFKIKMKSGDEYEYISESKRVPSDEMTRIDTLDDSVIYIRTSEIVHFVVSEI